MSVLARVLRLIPDAWVRPLVIGAAVVGVLVFFGATLRSWHQSKVIDDLRHERATLRGQKAALLDSLRIYTTYNENGEERTVSTRTAYPDTDSLRAAIRKDLLARFDEEGREVVARTEFRLKQENDSLRGRLRAAESTPDSLGFELDEDFAYHYLRGQLHVLPRQRLLDYDLQIVSKPQTIRVLGTRLDDRYEIMIDAGGPLLGLESNVTEPRYEPKKRPAYSAEAVGLYAPNTAFVGAGAAVRFGIPGTGLRSRISGGMAFSGPSVRQLKLGPYGMISIQYP